MNPRPPCLSALSRRGFLSWVGGGLGGAAALSLLGKAKAENLVPAFRPRARRAIHICLCGGLSQLDSFDYKPELIKRHGQPMPSTEKLDPFFGKVGPLRAPDWSFKQRGQSGLWVSELFPHLAGVADELCVIRSMVADSSNHTPATFQENSGFRFNGFPAMGAWISYALGSENENLPAFVVLPDARGLPAGTVANWANGFLPARHQGVALQSRGAPVRDLTPAQNVSAEHERDSLKLLAGLNAGHLAATGGDDVLEARMRSYELAARMQLAVPEVTDIQRESDATREDYGLNAEVTRDFGRNCLLARRLLERGVRFVQLFSGGAFGSPRINWDGHENVKENHGAEAPRIDRPVAALLKDLRQRGLLEDTLVLFTSEFGRTPYAQSESGKVGPGRDHHPHGFSVWMAGAGLRRGFAYGATDEFGHTAVVDPVTWPDFHATVLHLLGLDHHKLTYYHNGIDRRLTNVSGDVVHSLLA
ncbi:MAG TPA: DUF1501 domain-containing protein [Verrucomicrobiales bacterium]|nr:DUF1501 domain-containing protein [Verrucomicrobiales bacterium]